jgi:hypothetical protein
MRLFGWFRKPLPVCHWCTRGYPIGLTINGHSYGEKDHAITGWDGELRFEPCANPEKAIDRAEFDRREAQGISWT